jgi:hypothetical protein
MSDAAIRVSSIPPAVARNPVRRTWCSVAFAIA